MNGFVERSFRSVKDLARCMLQDAGLPDPYWERACSHSVLIRNILPNQSATGYAREAYFLWYGIMFDYSRLRTFGSRAYAINHIGAKDFGPRSVAGIFVGMKPTSPITIDYEIYLPSKDVFITSGDVVFCEHVGRKEPERLLPPLVTLPPTKRILDHTEYQHLVDTVHLDNEEGVLYKVLKVYTKRGVALVDRSLFSPNHESNDRGKIDCVYLDNVLGYPIIQGKSNSRYVRTSDLADAPDRLDQTSSISPNSANACTVTSNNEHVEAPPQAISNHFEKSGELPQSKEGATLMQSAVLHAKRL